MIMIDLPATLIEPGIGYWRSAQIDEDGFPTNLNFHDDIRVGKVGAIYPATVTKLDTNSDIAFLSLTEMVPEQGRKGEDIQKPLSGIMNLRRAKQLVKGAVHSISDCLHEGQKLMVQVLSDPTSFEDKSLTLTPKPRLDGRYVSVETGASRLNFSKDLGPKTLKALKEPLSSLTENVAIIVRARAAHVSPEAVIAEAKWLTEAVTSKAGYAMPAIERALIAVPDDNHPVYIDSVGASTDARALAQAKWPDLADRIFAYKRKTPAFEEYGVEEAIEDALSDRILLPSGGWISIHETPALTAIDVNMGSALQQMSAADAKLTVNMEAALAVAHHIRFQDIGGLIIVDFIDMSGKGTTAKLLELFDKALKDDPVPVRRSGISAFGLVEMARQRKGISLRDRYQTQHKPTMRIAERALTLLRNAQNVGLSNDPGVLNIQTDKAVQNWLKANPFAVHTLEAMTHRTIKICSGNDDVFIEGKS
jgi:Rne/Rng family ribonuclease